MQALPLPVSSADGNPVVGGAALLGVQLQGVRVPSSVRFDAAEGIFRGQSPETALNLS